MDDKYVIQLTSSNYQRWKFEIQAVLEAREVLDVVKGTEKKPDGTDQAKLKAWKKSDAIGRMVLSRSLDEEHHAFIRSCATSAEIWSTIVKVKEQSTVSTKLLANQQFHAFCYEPGMSIATFLSAFNVIVGKLESLGVKVDESSKIGKVIHCLPMEYDSFRQSWRLTSTDSSSFTDLQSQLLATEADMKSRDPMAASVGDAFYGEGNTGNNGKGNNSKGNGSQQSKQEAKGKAKKITCFKCDKPGHMKRDCPLNVKNKPSVGTSRDDGADGGYMAQNHVPSVTSNERWLGDSGAFAHITKHREWFSTFRSTDPHAIRVGGDQVLYSHGIGTIDVNVFDGKSWSRTRLNDVRFVPDFGSANLFSLGSAVSRGVTVVMDDDGLRLERNGKTEVTGTRSGTMFIMAVRTVIPSGSAMVAKPESIRLWHERLGHINVRKIRTMIKNGLADGLDVDTSSSDEVFCKGCLLGSMTRRSYKSVTNGRKCEPGEFIHADVCGPFGEASIGGSCLFVCYKDEASGYRRVFCIKDKSVVLGTFKTFVTEVKVQTGREVRLIHTDKGTEFLNKDFDDFIAEKGMIRETSPAYTPQCNGTAERENRTLLDKASSMLQAKGLPKRLWAEAIMTAAYVLNRVPNRKQTMDTPYSLWFGKKPDVSHLRVFGSAVYAHVPDTKRKKLDAKADEVILVGYGNSSKIFRVFDQNKNKVSEVTDVKFDEAPSGRMILVPDAETEDFNGNHPESEDETVIVEPEEDTELDADLLSTPPRSSNAEQVTAPKKRGRPPGAKNKPKSPPVTHPMSRRNINVVHSAMMARSDPLTAEEALARPDREQWYRAMSNEMESLQKNETWSLVEPPRNRPIVSCKWVFKTKIKPDGSLDKYKARLVAKGFTQKKGIDYSETYAPVVRYESVRVFLSIVAAEDLELVQFDVKTAFLHGELNEEIFMHQPEVFNDGTSKVCRLLKGLYGLKQAPRCWNEKMDTYLRSIGLVSTTADRCIYTSESGERILLALYVDDGLLACKSIDTMDRILAGLDKKFHITRSDPSCFVGLELDRNRERRSISIHQSNYVARILDKFGMTDCKSAKTPGDSRSKLTKESCPKSDDERETMKDIPYREAVGSLMFLMVCSRPDISFEVSRVSKFNENPGQEHWTAVKRIFRYLKGTRDYRVTYGLDPRHPILDTRPFDTFLPYAFCDSDWAGDQDNRHSTYGYVFMVNGGPVTWATRTQNSIAMSTTEAEYIALSETARESIWIRRIFMDLGHEQDRPIMIRSDNQGAIALSKNPEFHQRTKHIDIRYHFIREQESNGNIEVLYTSTDEQPADMLTKSLTSPLLNNCIDMLNVR